MSQEQPRKPEDQTEAVTYGDVFPGVQGGELADKVVAPKDTAIMQAAENAMLGKTIKGGAAATLQAAAKQNEKAGVVGPDDTNANIVTGDEGVSVKEADLPGRRITTESIAGQGSHSNTRNVDHEKQRKIYELVEAVGQYSQRAPLAAPNTIQAGGTCGQITIGEALEATAMTAGQKPVEWSDAAAIQAAEVRATGRTNIVPGGVAAAAQSAATLNARTTKDEEKTKLADILADATSKLPADKPATRRDAEGVTGAEMRNDPFLTTHPTGVAASVAAAARLNQINSNEMPK
ncbi:late embryogenesis abundant protein D-34-like isoform X1 [Prunus avium]|uniref:Late embryogenesis abundant protein D-34-like isoform X1 n=1 Tax=Prunus avium TaxID=42229 RepID=A0A6P5SMU8_PRUAV|nr:late embryogenesis abundant protein D-34-like isoform X1 [Prunus avium]